MKPVTTAAKHAVPRPKTIAKGHTPPCQLNGNQCRGCFGWHNMRHAAETNPAWRKYPLCCPVTGLTLKY